jgi:hypothetical protein
VTHPCKALHTISQSAIYIILKESRIHPAKTIAWGDWDQIREHLLSIVLLLPPAPAALVLLGRTFATLSFWSAAALLRIAVLGPPGGVGDEGRPVLWPAEAPGEFTGDEGRGEDCIEKAVSDWKIGQGKYYLCIWMC